MALLVNRPVSLLLVVSKIVAKLVNKRLVDHLQKCGHFSDFQYSFRSSRSTADQLIVVSNRIARAYNKSGATLAVELDITKAFDRIWHTSASQLKYYGISGLVFGLVSSFLSSRRLQLVLDGKCSQEYPLNAGVPQGSILGPILFLLYINQLPEGVICNVAIYADDTTLFSNFDQASDLRQQLELAPELKTGAIDGKIDRSLFEEKSSFKMLGQSFPSKLDCGSYTVSIPKTVSKKIGVLFSF